jgi:hypothetical protein
MPFDDFKDWSPFYKKFDYLMPDRMEGKLAILLPASGLHEYFKRHIVHYNNVMPDWAHLIVVENRNGVSYVPSIVPEQVKPKFKIKILRTPDNRPWVMASWFNMAARHTDADFIMPIGLDHIIPKEFFDNFLKFIEIHSNLHFAICMEKNGIFGENSEIVELEGDVESRTPHGICSMDMFKYLRGFNENYDYYNAEDTRFKLDAIDACKKVFNTKPMILSGPLKIYHALDGDLKPDFLKAAYARAPEAVRKFIVGETIYERA